MPTDRSPTESWSDFDRRMMARAIAMAQHGQGYVEPNPMVGCVIVRNGKIIGEGCHRRFGGPHAEVNALRSCTTSPRGATVYVSLEPCCHFGKTPPCTETLIRSHISCVIAATPDPNPLVRGKGLAALRAAGIQVRTGLLEREAAELTAPFRTRLERARPYVIAKWAQSLNGNLTTRRDDSKWISSEESRRRVHRLRARVDAILVGSGTVLVDDPLLTARNVPLRRVAVRVVLDGRLRIPERCQLVVTARRVPTLVFTTPSRAESTKADRLRRGGVAIETCVSRGGRLSLRKCLRKLARRDVTNLLVEGGPTVLTAFFKAGFVDEALVFVAPILLAGHTPSGPLASGSPIRVKDAIFPHSIRIFRSGRDLLYRLRFANGTRGFKRL